MQNNDYNRGGYIAFLFSMAFSLAFFIYVTVVHPGIDLKELPAEQPGATDAPVFDLASVEKPWESSEEIVAHAKKAYNMNCVVCHGETGEGNGPGGKGLNPPPRNFVEGKWTKGGGSIALFNTITNGIPGTSMASFAHLPAAERWALVHLIHSWTKNLVKDDPAKVEAFAKTAK